MRVTYVTDRCGAWSAEDERAVFRPENRAGTPSAFRSMAPCVGYDCIRVFLCARRVDIGKRTQRNRVRVSASAREECRDGLKKFLEFWCCRGAARVARLRPTPR